ncbi:uncharacterized protein LOC127537665 isoform X5 [Acanthochromis polyacanthus]|uniref:uncharacterized protein LOC127537665 isoform X5 n=1 Tax=Acanthochromis polyacanthus TaxID=80966 RepID=UPI0022341DAB|nr:uncharacterized protein LOC127537665 isoform X5 [Acanthochromis polyacanthus]
MVLQFHRSDKLLKLCPPLISMMLHLRFWYQRPQHSVLMVLQFQRSEKLLKLCPPLISMLLHLRFWYQRPQHSVLMVLQFQRSEKLLKLCPPLISMLLHLRIQPGATVNVSSRSRPVILKMTQGIGYFRAIVSVPVMH